MACVSAFNRTCRSSPDRICPARSLRAGRSRAPSAFLLVRLSVLGSLGGRASERTVRFYLAADNRGREPPEARARAYRPRARLIMRERRSTRLEDAASNGGRACLRQPDAAPTGARGARARGLHLSCGFGRSPPTTR